MFIIGTANFNRKYGISNYKINESDIKKIINNKKKDIKGVDTAYNYNISDYISGYFKKKNFLVDTKIDYNSFCSKDYIFFKEKIKAYLLQWKVKKFNILYIHDINIIKNKKKFIKYILFLKKIKKDNLINKIGISLYNPNDLIIIKKYLIPDAIQFPLNIFDQEFVKSKWYQYCIEKKIKLFARSIFLQGLLLREKNKIPEKFKKNKKFKIKLNHFENFCLEYGISKLEACVGFVKLYKLNGIVIGINNINQLNEILKVKKLKIKHQLEIKKLSIKNKKITKPYFWKYL